MTNQEYIDKYADYAMQQMREHGIPASITLAQGILESASGNSELSQRGNNHFGVKASNSWLQRGGSFLVYDDDKPKEKFCRYASVADSYEHHSQILLQNDRYQGLFRLNPSDYKGWSEGLQAAGYATAKTYASSLQSIIEKNDLQQYDRMVLSTSATANDLSSGLSASGHYSLPLDRKDFMLVTSDFGTRTDPVKGDKKQFHKGIDIRCNHEKLLATEDNGTVISVNQNANTGGGKSITIEYNRQDGSKYQATYMHMSQIDVKEGDQVMAGQQVGISGNTGLRTTGPHLHFGVKSVASDGSSRDIDPAAYIAEISQKGSLHQQLLYNGTDLLGKYEDSELTRPAALPEVRSDERSLASQPSQLTPTQWIEQLLTSNDSGIDDIYDYEEDSLLSRVVTFFASLAAIAFSNRPQHQQMQRATAAALDKTIDLSDAVKGQQECAIHIQDDKAYLSVVNPSISFTHSITADEKVQLEQVMNDPSTTKEEKRNSIAQFASGIIVREQLSQNYEQGLDNTRSKGLQLS